MKALETALDLRAVPVGGEYDTEVRGASPNELMLSVLLSLTVIAIPALIAVTILVKTTAGQMNTRTRESEQRAATRTPVDFEVGVADAPSLHGSGGRRRVGRARDVSVFGAAVVVDGTDWHVGDRISVRISERTGRATLHARVVGRSRVSRIHGTKRLLHLKTEALQVGLDTHTTPASAAA